MLGKTMKVSIVILCYNEKGTIEKIVDAVRVNNPNRSPMRINE